MSVLIGLLILFGGLRVLREASSVLLELPPRGLALDELAEEMEFVPGVLDVHDLHVWAITPQLVTLAAHVQVGDQPLAAAVHAALQERLQELGIGHATLQLECHGCAEGRTFCHRLKPLEERGPEGEGGPGEDPLGGPLCPADGADAELGHPGASEADRAAGGDLLRRRTTRAGALPHRGVPGRGRAGLEGAWPRGPPV